MSGALLAMSGAIAAAQAAAAPAGDVVLWLKMEGTDGSSTFIDEAGATITNIGTPTISTGNPGFAASCGLFGAADGADFPDITLTGDYDMAIRCYITAWGVADRQLLYVRSADVGFQFYISAPGGVVVDYNGGVTVAASDPGVIALNTAYTILLTRRGTDVEVLVNDVSVATGTDATSLVLDRIGSVSGTYGVIGNLSQAKITDLS